jgi:NADPH:quinone reductase-like Zn-dependent oxidoreductase
VTKEGEVMMRAMRAESFTGYGGLKLVERPKPLLADGRVLVRITAAGVTPLDHTILNPLFRASSSVAETLGCIICHPSTRAMEVST